MGNEISVRLTVFAFECEPKKISTQLELKPSFAWRKGDYIKGTIRQYDCNGWRYDSPLAEVNPEASLEDQAVALLDVIEQRLAAVVRIGKIAQIELSCIVYANEYIPSLAFSNETLQRIARIGASLDIDLYDLS